MFILDTLKEARILISIVVVFIFCQSFTIVADAYEAFTCSYEKMRKSMCPSNPTIENIIDFSHFLLTINSSINFALYVLHDKTFKEAIVKVSKMYIVSIVYQNKKLEVDLDMIYTILYFISTFLDI